MKKLGKALGAIAIAGAIIAGGSAFTASNTGNGLNASVHGYGTQTISGVSATSVVYTLDAAKENITFVDLDLVGDTTTLTIQIAFGAAGSHPVPVTCADATNPNGLYTTSTVYHCPVSQAVATAGMFVLVAS